MFKIIIESYTLSNPGELLIAKSYKEIDITNANVFKKIFKSKNR